jgi:hypothetical protein
MLVAHPSKGGPIYFYNPTEPVLARLGKYNHFSNCTVLSLNTSLLLRHARISRFSATEPGKILPCP